MDARWKGHRRGLGAMVPKPFGLAIRRTAEHFDMSITDLVQDLVALEVGQPTRVLTRRLDLAALPDVASLLTGELDWRDPDLDLIQGRVPKAIVDAVQRIAVREQSTIRHVCRGLLARAYGLEVTVAPSAHGPRQRAALFDEGVLVLSAAS